ncbi:hypothetical protein Glove_40g12 [Diversispora epigaea]|uniref:CSC1/OSCA1-like 7TM region domain-containing protein n=1 Tax=Diversispora epigaea TaxID=1348612 RepID=A0A397JPI2_9GLOM|nr:hypothetical protein Glove_40g12 [Diversispora epigaea]
MSGVVTGDQQAQNISLTGMYSQLAINFAIGVGTLFVFGFLRPRNGIVYAPKQIYVNEKKQPPKIENGLFSWVKPVWNTPESLLIEKIGLDAVMFIRFITLCRNLFLWFFILGCAIIVPINVYGTLQDRGNLPSTDNPLAILSIAFLKQSNWFWTHVVLTWLFSVILYRFLYTQYKEYSKLKLDYFSSEEYQKSLHSRTLLVMGIPHSMKTDEELKTFVDSLRLKYPITEAHISRKVDNLTELLKEHSEAVRKLEGILCKYLKDPDNIPSSRPTHRSSFCFGAKIDSIDHYTEKIQSLERQIKDAREISSKKKPQNYGFISFANISQAHAAAKKLEKISTKNLTSPTFVLAPWPKDIIWNNLSNVGAVKGTKRFLSYSLFLALCFFWLVPVSFISTAAKISNIVRLAPVTAKIFYANHFITGLLEAWMSPLILAIFFLMLPSILRYLSHFQGKITKSSLERSTLAKLYLFFILNSIIIYTASSTALDIVSKIRAVLNQKNSNVKDIYSVFQNSDIFEQIADSMISVSTFWINYISLRGVGVIFDLAQIASLLIKFSKGLYVTQTPRNVMEYSRPPDFDYSVYYNVHMFFFTIGILYCVIAPIILIFCVSYFSLAYLVYRYQLMYVFTTKVETGGTYWRVVFNRLIVSILFWQCVMVGVMNLKGAHIQSLAVLPLPAITIFLKIMCSRSFDEKIRYGIIDSSSEEEKNEFIDGRDQVSNRFLHPSITAELIAPMVPAGAKNALSKVYNGRIEETTEEKRGKIRTVSRIISLSGAINIETVEDNDCKVDEVAYLEEQEPGYYAYYEDNPSYGYHSFDQKNNGESNQLFEFDNNNSFSRQNPLNIKSDYFDAPSYQTYQTYQPSTPSPSPSQTTLNQSLNTREYLQQPISHQQYNNSYSIQDDDENDEMEDININSNGNRNGDGNGNENNINDTVDYY